MARIYSDIYLYLARRDRSSVRILCKLRGYEINASRIQNVDTLGLPPDWTTALNQIIYDNRMLWEPWVESADTYEDLKDSLRLRGYKNLPMSGQPEFTAANTASPVVNPNALPRRTVMVQKRKD